ncbi:hypothetical protein [Natrinema sp. H-ect4]|uniref:DUF7289 family protein n=1 Tax=Natrinema sp. H-ect4 TaxID=3242699 RepID=UPI0035A96D23
MNSRGEGRVTVTSNSGQSAVLSLVILIGMVATVSVGILFVAGDMMSNAEDQSETERVEQSFAELSKEITTASLNSDVSRTMDFDIGQDGAIVRKETGHINVTSEALEEDIDLTIGTIEYKSRDGTTFAYQAGTVFRETGNETRIVSSPSIHYDTTTKTLNLPVVTVSGQQDLGSGDVQLSHNGTMSFQEANVVENESITITIESDYYRGWESYFRNQAGDTSVQDVDHENRTVEVKVGYIDLESAYDSGVTYSEEIDDFKDEFGDQGRVGNMPEMDPVIEDMIEDVQEDIEDDPNKDLGVIDSDEHLENGTYYADEIDLQGDHTISADASDGNVTLIVDGNITMSDNDARLTVDTGGEDNSLRVYTTGNFEMDKGEVAPDPSTGTPSAKQLQVYGTSELDGKFWKGYFHGTFYAASNDWEGPNELTGDDYQVVFHSNPEFNGSLVVHSANLHSSAAKFDYDDSLEGNKFNAYPEGYDLPPQLTYLNVVRHEVKVEQN